MSRSSEKLRLAPVKVVSIRRLELQAAHAWSRQAASILEPLGPRLDYVYKF